VGNTEWSAMKERRKTKRRYLLYYARIFDPATRHQIGSLVDITPRGAMVLSPDPFIVGVTYRLRLELSEDVSEHPYLDFTVLSKWSHADIDPRLFNTGFEIIEVDKAGADAIQRIVGIYGFRDNLLHKDK
jgi:hypothetical protein